MKKRTLDQAFVPPTEMRAVMEHFWRLVEQRAYEIFKCRGGLDGHDFDDWIQAEAELLQSVTAEVSDAGDAFIAIAAVTHYRPEDLRVSVEPRCVTICGLTTGKNNNRGSSDDAPQLPRFHLSFKLPADVNTSAASADLRRDILEIRLPKALPQKNA